MTLDRKTIDSIGAYLLSLLTKYDPAMHQPIQRYTWTRDIAVRSDLTLGMEYAAFSQDSFSATNTIGSKV